MVFALNFFLLLAKFLLACFCSDPDSDFWSAVAAAAAAAAAAAVDTGLRILAAAKFVCSRLFFLFALEGPVQ